MTQGDVYWYTFKEPDKRRPVLILTRSSAIQFLTSPTVAPITAASVRFQPRWCSIKLTGSLQSVR